MRMTLRVALGISTALLVTSAAQANKAQLIPIIPFPNASSTSVFGIADDNNTITGSYVSNDDGLTHGFYGTLDGNYTSYDFPGGPDTQARGINGTGRLITGFSNITATHCEFIEWQYNVNTGRSEQITKNEVPVFGIVMGINRDTFAGDYCTDDGVIHGQLGARYKWQSDVTTPFDSPYTGERAVNKDSTVVGFYVDPNTGLQIGTVVAKDGTTSTFTYPSDTQQYTVFEGLNNKHLSAGQWGDSNGIVHSFTYNLKTGNVAEIDDPNAASFTQAWGVNANGLVAVTSDAGAYIYCKNTNCPSTGLKAIVLNDHTSTAPLKRLVSYGDIKHGKGHAPIKQVLPKGAAIQ